MTSTGVVITMRTLLSPDYTDSIKKTWRKKKRGGVQGVAREI